jgi:hypothetical protein
MSATSPPSCSPLRSRLRLRLDGADGRRSVSFHSTYSPPISHYRAHDARDIRKLACAPCTAQGTPRPVAPLLARGARHGLRSVFSRSPVVGRTPARPCILQSILRRYSLTRRPCLVTGHTTCRIFSNLNRIVAAPSRSLPREALGGDLRPPLSPSSCSWVSSHSIPQDSPLSR